MLERKDFCAYIKWEGKEYPVDVKHSDRFKKHEVGYLNFKRITITLALVDAGIRTTVSTVDYIDDDDNLHGHKVPALLYVNYKELKDGKDEVTVFAASDDLLWCKEVGKATVIVNPLKENKGQWGGKREGAGRKRSNTKPVVVRLTDEQHEKLKELGGSAWLQKTIQYAEILDLQKQKIEQTKEALRNTPDGEQVAILDSVTGKPIQIFEIKNKKE